MRGRGCAPITAQCVQQRGRHHRLPMQSMKHPEKPTPPLAKVQQWLAKVCKHFGVEASVFFATIQLQKRLLAMTAPPPPLAAPTAIDANTKTRTHTRVDDDSKDNVNARATTLPFYEKTLVGNSSITRSSILEM